MSDEIKDKTVLKRKNHQIWKILLQNLNRMLRRCQRGDFDRKHSDYKPVNRFDASAVHHLSGMYQNWFLDYASYVILERAVPHIEDGLKPVQRRILHSMKRMDDGRYNKVANIVGHTMQFHPHGDASIGDALVQMGQKDLLIDTQGNWGNILTGDRAAAPRYIEARLSKFALDGFSILKLPTGNSLMMAETRSLSRSPAKFRCSWHKVPRVLPWDWAVRFCHIISMRFAMLPSTISKGEPFQLYPDFPYRRCHRWVNTMMDSEVVHWR